MYAVTIHLYVHSRRKANENWRRLETCNNNGLSRDSITYTSQILSSVIDGLVNLKSARFYFPRRALFTSRNNAKGKCDDSLYVSLGFMSFRQRPLQSNRL
jgi:hypothetical protein